MPDKRLHGWSLEAVTLGALTRPLRDLRPVTNQALPMSLLEAGEVVGCLSHFFPGAGHLNYQKRCQIKAWSDLKGTTLVWEKLMTQWLRVASRTAALDSKIVVRSDDLQRHRYVIRKETCVVPGVF